MIRRRFLSLGILACCLIFSIGCDYQIPLSSGYKIGRIAGGDTFVLAYPENSVIVGPSVIGYRDSKDLVVGLVEPPPGESHGHREGYFLVDKKTQSAIWGLTKEEWLLKLQEHGIKEEPHLVRPNRFQAWF